MDKQNNSKKKYSKTIVKGGVSSTKSGKGNKGKVKKYVIVDFMQLCAYNLPEGLKIPYNGSGKAVLDYLSPNMDWSYLYKYTFYRQAAPTKHSKMSNLVFGPKRTKVGQRRRPKVVTPPRQHEAEDLFHEVFVGLALRSFNLISWFSRCTYYNWIYFDNTCTAIDCSSYVDNF